MDALPEEFGHSSIALRGTTICSWGAGPFVIQSEGRRFRFEDSDRFGPVALTARDDFRERQPGERSPFWRAHRIWVRQGRRLMPDNTTCIWDEPRPQILQRIAGRHCLVIDEGEEDGKAIVQEPAS
jgi:hypothetical protein